jgi:hypothetical protein
MLKFHQILFVLTLLTITLADTTKMLIAKNKEVLKSQGSGIAGDVENMIKNVISSAIVYKGTNMA